MGGRHVSAFDDSQEGRQAASLLERCREPARRRRARGAAARGFYLGEINSSQELAWRKSIEVLEDGAERPRTLALFPEDRCEGLLPDASIIRLKLSQLRLCRPRQWGACWLALRLWEELRLDRFWAERLAPSRKGTRWDQVPACAPAAGRDRHRACECRRARRRRPADPPGHCARTIGDAAAIRCPATAHPEAGRHGVPVDRERVRGHGGHATSRGAFRRSPSKSARVADIIFGHDIGHVFGNYGTPT